MGKTTITQFEAKPVNLFTHLDPVISWLGSSQGYKQVNVPFSVTYKGKKIKMEQFGYLIARR